MITLYGIHSPYVYRVRAALLQKQLPFQHVSVNFQNRSDEFKQLTPVGKIPILTDTDGTVVYDSMHIVQYLDRAYPDTYSMTGTTPAEYASIMNAVALADKATWIMSPLVYDALGLIERFGKVLSAKRGLAKFDDEQKTALREEIQDILSKIASELNGAEYLAAGRFTLADAVLLTTLSSLIRGNESIAPLAAYREKLLANPQIASMFTPEDEKGVKEI